MKIIAESHLDHGLSPEIVQFIKDTFGDRTEPFAEEVLLPRKLGTVLTALHFVSLADERAFMAVRGNRAGPSRMIDLAPKPTYLLTVIAGPHEDEPCVLYTAHGGEKAPREPWDSNLTPQEKLESEEFWSRHALSASVFGVTDPRKK